MLTLSDPGYEVWHRFSTGRSSDFDHPVVPRWKRLQALRAAQSRAGSASETGLPVRQERVSRLFEQGQGLLRAGADELHRRGYSLLLADPDGKLLAARGLDTFTDPSMRQRFTHGQPWDEAKRGTNAIGTALAEGGPVAVIGRAHYDSDLHALACYAAPVHDIDGQLVAVVDVTGPVEAADSLLGITVEGLAAGLEGLLRAQAFGQLATRIGLLESQQSESRTDRDRLAEALRANESFLATVGHDLRNPLQAVLTSAELLVAGDDSRYQRAAERIRSSGRRMLGLLDQLSDLTRARLAGGIRVFSEEPVDLASLAAHIVEEMRTVHPERRIVLDGSGDARGFWETVRAEQVISNLLANALRHGAQTEPVRVVIDGNRSPTVSLVVTNAGEIEPSIRSHIFDPFRSTAARRAGGEGLGLGLYIVQQVVRAYQGDIDVVSRYGVTTFRVTLPRRVDFGAA